MMSIDADVLVLGAGVAGLAAARDLSRAGRKVILLESRDYFGGRIATKHDPQWPVPIELGAEFIHGKPREMWDLIDAAALPAYDVTNTHWQDVGNRIDRSDDFWEQVDAVFKRFDLVGTKPQDDLSLRDFLRIHCSDVPEDIRAMAASFVEGFDAANVDEVGIAWLRQMQEASDAMDGERSFRLACGYDALVRSLVAGFDAARVDTRLSHHVRHVHWQPGSVQVDTTHLTTDRSVQLHANAAVVTLPLAVLQAREQSMWTVTFEPPLDAKRKALAGLRMGSVSKVILRFREAFWRDREFADLAFIHSQDGGAWFPTWWTQLPFRAAVLTGWAGGPAAQRLIGKSGTDVLNAALSDVARLLRCEISKVQGQLASWDRYDWHADGLTRGAYSYATAGNADAPGELARPLDSTLFFAGEATHSTQSGTVAGAIETGRRAAREVLES